MKRKKEVISIVADTDIFLHVVRDYELKDINYSYFYNKKFVLRIYLGTQCMMDSQITFFKRGINFSGKFREKDENHEVTYEEMSKRLEKFTSFEVRKECVKKAGDYNDINDMLLYYLISLYEATKGELPNSEYVLCKSKNEYEIKEEIFELILFSRKEVEMTPNFDLIPCIMLKDGVYQRIEKKVGGKADEWQTCLPFDEFYIQIGQEKIYCINEDVIKIVKVYQANELKATLVNLLEKPEKFFTKTSLASLDVAKYMWILRNILYYIFFYRIERKYERKDVKLDVVQEGKEEIKVQKRGENIIFLPADKIISEGEKVTKMRVKEPEYILPSWQRRGFINKNGTYVAPTTVHRSKELLKEGGVKKEENRRIYQITEDRVDKSKK